MAMIRCGIPNCPSCALTALPAPFYPKAAALSHPLPRAKSQHSSTRLALVLCLALLAAVALALRHRALNTPGMAQQQTLETQAPLLCMHTLLENEVEESKIQRSLEMTRELGAGTIVQFFPWAYVESARGRYDWTRTDAIIRLARQQGLRVIARLGLTPGWARPADSPLTTLPDSSFRAFAAYAAAFAARYAADVRHIIIWNEPNLSAEWGFEPADPARYARLLREVYPRVKAANPEIVVLAGALAPTLEAADSPVGMNDLDFLRELYSLGAGARFDALAAHTYGFRELPEAPPAPALLNFRRVELLREIMLANGDGDKPVYITESGWNDHPRWQQAVRPSQRAAWTVPALQYAETRWDWLDSLCIWALRYPADLRGWPDGYTLLTADFLRKPIYFDLQAYARGWDTRGMLWLPPPQQK